VDTGQFECQTIVSFPKCFETSLLNTFGTEDVELVLDCLRKYLNEKNTDKSILTLGSQAGSERIQSAFLILRDWLDHGAFVLERERTWWGVSGGRIDWNKTVARQIPTFQNDVPIYGQFHLRGFEADTEAKIHAIHQWCVKRAAAILMWLVESAADVLGELVDVRAEPPFPKNECLLFLEQQRGLEYVERHLWLIQELENFIRADERWGDRGDIVFGVRNFERVWERMCGSVLGHNEDLRSRVPQPKYELEVGQGFMQRPDILLGTTAIEMVVDAKYYAKAAGFPGWHDLAKQFFYAVSLRDAEVRPVNVMVFPSMDSPTWTEPKWVILYKGGKPLFNLGVVYCVFLPIKQIMKCYARDRGAKSIQTVFEGRLAELKTQFSERVKSP
jgi:hypothetical protein